MLLLLLACTGASDSAVPDHDASLRFLDPVDGDTLAVGTHAISLLVDGFSLVEAKHNEGMPTGFLVVRLDGEEVLTTGATVFDVTFPEAGEVTLSAALEYADGDPLDPPVEASIGLTITP